MNKNVPLFLLMMFPGWLSGQLNLYEKRQLTEAEVTTVFSYYKQDGIHSAVTGGRGTEKLDVFSATSMLSIDFDTMRQFTASLGFDYISSASTDKIDFQRSSASEHDQRIYAHVSYGQDLKNQAWSLQGGVSGSAESDYFSMGLNGGLSWQSTDRSRGVDVDVQYFRDDLRWRKNFFKPSELIYPEELRDTTWLNGHRRQSLNVSFALRQDVNKRMRIAFFPSLVYQQGILSTPFHRVYFEGETTPRVEKLPAKRWKIPLGIQLNTFISHILVVRAGYQYYRDNFGVRGHSWLLEMPVKFGSFLTWTPSARYYSQRESTYFQPYGSHQSSASYYTSDNDLSSFNSWKIGLEFKSLSNKILFKRHWLFDQFSVRYAYYHRSDSLSAHMISTVFDISKSSY